MSIKTNKYTILKVLGVLIIGVCCSYFSYIYYTKDDIVDYNELENTVIKDKEVSKGSFEDYTIKYGLWKINKVLVYKDGHKYYIIDGLLDSDKVGKNNIIEVRNPTKEEIIDYSKERWKLNETKAVH